MTAALPFSKVRDNSASDVLGAILHALDASKNTFAEDLTQLCAGDLRNGMQIVEKVHGKRRYFTVWGHPLHKGHEVYVTVSVNGHKLNWRYQIEAPVQIKEN